MFVRLTKGDIERIQNGEELICGSVEIGSEIEHIKVGMIK